MRNADSRDSGMVSPLNPLHEHPPTLFIGIGLAAGGLESLRSIIEALSPSPGAALFLAFPNGFHAAVDVVRAKLGSMSLLSIEEAADGLHVVANRIYVPPHGADVALLDGVLHLAPHAVEPSERTPVDFFFRALALDQKSRAVAIVLSGEGMDGAEGIRTIKDEGGVVFVQQPSSAMADEMPNAAIASNVADFVFSPGEIGRRLAMLGEKAESNTDQESDLDRLLPDGEDLTNVLALLRGSSGVDLTHYKRTTIKRRIKRRMALKRVDTLSGYLAHLRGDASEIVLLFNDLLINVTHFFRDPDTFDTLRDKVIPEILRRREPNAVVRVWVAGCSTGEEVYSIAICFAEACAMLGVNVPIQIFATDIDEHALERARAGVFSASLRTHVSDLRLKRFFTPEDGSFRVIKSLRDMCIFSRQDVTRDPPFSNLDLLSCRNVLIYLAPVLQKKVMHTFNYALKPAGFLVFGSSETVGSYSHLFSMFDKKERIYLKKPVVLRQGSDLSQLSDFVVHSNVLPRVGRAPLMAKHDARLEADRFVLSRFAPPGVLVDSALEILQFRGHTGLFFEPSPGDASFNVMKMVRTSLRVKLRGALQDAKRKGSSVMTDAVRFSAEGYPREVHMEVVPIHYASAEPCYLVLFNEVKGAGRGGKPERPLTRTDASTPASTRSDSGEVLTEEEASSDKSDEDENLALRHELAAAQQYLQSIIQNLELTNQELQSANEEVVSTNEELQSMNEELETAKEELQSTNEELHTVNEELSTRNLDLAASNADLSNLIANVPIPILIVGIDLKIRRSTPAAEKIFNVQAGDVGRSISHIRPNVDVPDLPMRISEVIDTLSSKECDVSDLSGRWYTMFIRPSRTADNRIDGAVVSVLDIQRLKQEERRLAEMRATSEILFAGIPLPVVVIGGDRIVRRANPAFLALFGVSTVEVEGRPIVEIAETNGRAPQLARALEAYFSRQDDRLASFREDVPVATLGVIGAPVKKFTLFLQRRATSDVESDVVATLIPLA